MTTIVELLRRNYASVSKELLAPLLSLLREAEQEFGDLDKFHILLAVALRTAEHPQAATLSLEAIESGAVVDLPSLHTNVHSIALSTGLPEETVRRKVNALVQCGFIKKYDHSLCYTAKAMRKLVRIRREILKLSSINYRTVRRMLCEKSSVVAETGL